MQSADLEEIRMLSMYTNTEQFNMSRETLLTRDCKTVGALVSPKGITKYSKWPYGVLNAVFHSSPTRMRTKWYALRRSNLVKTKAPWRGTKA